MSGHTTGSADVEASSDGVAIRPFTIDVPEEELTDLRSRINATKWPDRETDASQGVQLATIQALASYWETEYDWRKFEGLLGIHTNMPATVPPDVSKALATGGPEPSGLSADEKKAYEVLDHFYATGTGYAGEMGNRPQTLYGVADSPVGLAAWMIDHDVRSYELIARAFDGDAGGLSRDDVLDNVTHYWLTNTGVSAGRLYWESKLAFFDVKGVEIPVGVSVFPDELYPAPQSWAEKAYPNLIHFNNELDEGGHFAAWEQPQAFSEEVRASFRSLR